MKTVDSSPLATLQSAARALSNLGRQSISINLGTTLFDVLLEAGADIQTIEPSMSDDDRFCIAKLSLYGVEFVAFSQSANDARFIGTYDEDTRCHAS